MKEEILNLIAVGCNQCQELIDKLGSNHTTYEINNAITELLINDIIAYEPNVGYVMVDYNRVDDMRALILDAIRRRYYTLADLSNYIGVYDWDNEFVLALSALKREGAVVYYPGIGYLIGKESKQDKVVFGVLFRVDAAIGQLRLGVTSNYVDKVRRLIALAERIAAKYKVADYYLELLAGYKYELSLFNLK